MAQDNRLIQEFQNNTLVFDIGSVGADNTPNGQVSLSGIYGGAVMPYRQAPLGGLSDNLAPLSGLATPGETDSVNKHPINRVCVFENEIHNIGQGQWHKQDETTGSWDLVFDLDDYNAHSAYQNIGLYPVFNRFTNTRHLVTAYYTTIGSSWVGLSYNKDTNVVTSGLLSASLGGNGDLSPQDCQLGNNIHFTGSDTDSRVITLDGLSLEITSSTFGDVHRPVDLCAYSGCVYMAHKDRTVPGTSSSGVITISCMTPVWHPVLRIPFENTPYAVGDVSTSVPRQKCILFVDNNPLTSSGTPTMWLYYQNNPQITPVGLSQSSFEGAGIYGWSVWEIQGDGLGGLSVVQQKDTLMGTWRAGLAESVIPIGNADQGVISYCDNYPGWFITSPEKSFLTMRPMGGEPGQTHKQWDFDPVGGTAPSPGSALYGDATKMSYVQDKIGGGSRWSPAATSTTTALDVNIFDIAYASGHLVNATPSGAGAPYTAWRIHYKLMPSTAYHAGTVVTVRWYYDEFYAPNKRITMINEASSVSHGTISNNQLINVTMSSGVDYWMDWDFQADNFNPDDTLYLCGLVFTAGADIPEFGL